jgi:RNA 3'-terminal phosphate cyclase (ATP)
MLETGNSILRVDGAQGEGGGQVLRTALALSAIRGIPVEIHSIRARREVPGLQAQHLTAVTALGQITDARVEGASLGSRQVLFAPGPVRPGEYRFDVGTAGSAALVLQTILLPLALAGGPSRIVLTGGTHVPWSPPAHYLSEVLFPVLAQMGLMARLHLERWGFYPRGGGRVVVEVDGGRGARPITLVRPGGAIRLHGVSAVASLSRRIAERQRDRALRRLETEGLQAEITVAEVEAHGAGTFLMLVADLGGLPAGFSSLGERGRPAEQVADEVVNGLLDFLKAEAGCDPHLADQLILPMALAPGTSRLTTSRVTQHLLTTIQIVQEGLGCPMQVGGEEGSAGQVTIEGVGAAYPQGGREPRGESKPLLGASDVQSTTADSAIRNPQSAIGPEALVRKARAADVPAVQRLVSHLAARGDLLPRTLNELYRHLRDFFVCELDGEVVGISALSVYWEDLAEIRTLAVQDALGGRGLGRALVNACLEEAARLGVRRVFALTYRPGFFQRLGFHTIDKRELPQKIWTDCIKCAKFTCCDEVALIRDT